MYILSSAFSGIIGLIFMIIWLALTVFALINLIRNHQQIVNLGNKVLWAAIIIVVPIIGALMYFVWRSSRKPEA